MERANLLFGCYRRGDANDPDTYVTAVTAVLSRYPAEIVRAVTDPFSGLPSLTKENGYSGMPDVADVKAACEAEASRIERMERYAALPRTNFKRLPRPPAGPGAYATIHVLPDTPQYPRMLKAIETADRRKWKHDENGRGIWVSYDMIDGSGGGMLHVFSQMTDERLRQLYPPQQLAQEAAE